MVPIGEGGISRCVSKPRVIRRQKGQEKASYLRWGGVRTENGRSEEVKKWLSPLQPPKGVLNTREDGPHGIYRPLPP